MSYRDPVQKPVLTAPAGASAKSSILAADLQIDGHVTSTGRIEVHCQIKGNLAGPHLMVEPDAKVQGDITAEQLDLGGTVMGDVTATVVDIHPTGRLTGRITYEALSVAAGAIIEGDLHRMAAAEPALPDPVAPQPSGSASE